MPGDALEMFERLVWVRRGRMEWRFGHRWEIVSSENLWRGGLMLQVAVMTCLVSHVIRAVYWCV